MNLLDNPTVVEWCFQGVTKLTLASTSDSKKLDRYRTEEREWARNIIGGKGSQWTTLLCQNIAAEALQALGRNNVRTPERKISTMGVKGYLPDLECDDYIYEVKGRNWTTTGTAGEKILGVPLKYGELPRLYGKPLKVILVGYQEFEARSGFAFGDLLDENFQTPELAESLAFFEHKGIQYIGLTDMLKALGKGKEFWNGRS